MLSAQERSQIRDRLKQAQVQLLQNAQSSLRNSMDRASDTGRDSIDQSVSEGLLSTDLRLRDREKKLLIKIQDAVRRLDKNEIDECEDCGEAIGFKRLMARPVTTLCIHCKETREEKEKREVPESPGLGSLDGSIPGEEEE